MNKAPRMSAKKKLTASDQDYALELKFAKKVLKGDCEIYDFPYADSYQETLEAEFKHLPRKVLVVGAGPFPLSAIMIRYLQDEGDFNVDAIDKCPKAAKIGRRVLDKVYACKDVPIHVCAAEDFINYNCYDSILLTLEAGSSLADKRKILKTIHDQVTKFTNIVVRSSNTKDYLNSYDLIRKVGFVVEHSIPTFEGLSTSFIIHKR